MGNRKYVALGSFGGKRGSHDLFSPLGRIRALNLAKQNHQLRMKNLKLEAMIKERNVPPSEDNFLFDQDEDREHHYYSIRESPPPRQNLHNRLCREKNWAAFRKTVLKFMAKEGVMTCEDQNCMVKQLQVLVVTASCKYLTFSILIVV